MINWPKSLIREIATRRCIFFLGAGVSATAKDTCGDSPPSWGKFIDKALELVSDEPYRKSIKDLIGAKNYLLALQAIKDKVDAGEFRNLLDKTFNSKKFKPSALHEYILKLDSRFVITTNFDKIYENLCITSDTAGAFKTVNYYNVDLCDEIRSDTRLIIKAHGSIDEIRKMIFTRAEYHKAKSQYRDFYSILKSLFITNTVVFIGCSMDDPDVNLLLEDVKIMTNGTKSHYVLVKSDSKNEIIINDWNNTYNISALKYGSDHGSLITSMEELVTAVEQERAETLQLP